jgi:hypothetical protein
VVDDYGWELDYCAECMESVEPVPLTPDCAYVYRVIAAPYWHLPAGGIWSHKQIP